MPKNGGWISWHWWHYSDNWNGNNRKVLPFLTSARVVRRSGWRCLDCNEFVWDLSDKEFALSYAESIGVIKLPTSRIADSVNEPESESPSSTLKATKVAGLELLSMAISRADE